MPKAVPTSQATFSRAWLAGTSMPDMMARFNLSERTVQRRCTAYGLPHRKSGTKPAVDSALLVEIFRFGLTFAAMAAATGVGASSIKRRIYRLGEPRRGHGFRPSGPRPTLNDYLQHKMATAMSASAAKTRRVETAMAQFDRMHFGGKHKPKWLDASEMAGAR